MQVAYEALGFSDMVIIGWIITMRDIEARRRSNAAASSAGAGC